jgi:hypothetical protein
MSEEMLNRWYQKFLLENKVPNLKHQITNNSQISIINDQNKVDVESLCRSRAAGKKAEGTIVG